MSGAELARAGAGELVVIGEGDRTVSTVTAERMARAIPATTRRAHDYAIGEFTEWCDAQGRIALPATPQTLAEYVSAMVTADLAPATIEQAIGLIRGWHKRAGHRDQPDTAPALLVLRLHQRERAERGRGQVQAIPFSRATIHQCIDAMDLETRHHRRDQLALVFGFLMMARRSELAGLWCGDITDTPDGLDVLVRKSKTDKESRGHTRSLPPQSHPDVDPVRLYRAWVAALPDAADPTAPLLRNMRKGDRLAGPLAPAGVNNIVKAAARRACLPEADRYTAHSLRAGGLTDALRRGVPPGIAAQHGGWDKESPMLGRYARVANRWRDNAMAGAL